MAHVLLGVTGSVAAIRTPPLVAALRSDGHAVRVVATDASLYFFDPAECGPTGTVLTDADEWPGRRNGGRYRPGDAVLHIELRRWADILLIAPLDAHTLAKLAGGLCDNCLTCVFRAWDVGRPIVLAPAMNTLMWRHPTTAAHLVAVSSMLQSTPVPADRDPDRVLEGINRRDGRLRVVAPVEKMLACGDVGVGAIAPVDSIVAAVRSSVSAGLPSVSAGLSAASETPTDSHGGPAD